MLETNSVVWIGLCFFFGGLLGGVLCGEDSVSVVDGVRSAELWFSFFCLRLSLRLFGMTLGIGGLPSVSLASGVAVWGILA